MKKLVKENLNEYEDYSNLWKLKPQQSRHDDSQFCLSLAEEGYVCAMGDEFNPNAYNMTLEDMIEYVKEGINKFLQSSKEEFTHDDLGDYADFFESEFNDDDGFGVAETLTKEYVVKKMLCGIASAKSF